VFSVAVYWFFSKIYTALGDTRYSEDCYPEDRYSNTWLLIYTESVCCANVLCMAVNALSRRSAWHMNASRSNGTMFAQLFHMYGQVVQEGRSVWLNDIVGVHSNDVSYKRQFIPILMRVMRFCHTSSVPARGLWHDVPPQGKVAMTVWIWPCLMSEPNPWQAARCPCDLSE